MHHRIEKSAFRHGEYVGHCNGAQRIRRGGLGWKTYALGSSAGRFTPATARTLDALGARLDEAEARLGNAGSEQSALDRHIENAALMDEAQGAEVQP